MYVELARKRRHGADVEVERESNPETQKISVDDPSVHHRQRAEHEARQTLAKQRVLEQPLYILPLVMQR